MLPNFQIIAATPSSLSDPSVAIAASRAGAIGVVDLQYCRDESIAISSLDRLARFGKDKMGVKLDSGDGGFASRLIEALPKEISLAILTPSGKDLHDIVRLLQRRSIKVLLEAVCLDEARLGELCGVDEVIAKGHESGGRIGEETAFILLQKLLSSIALPVWAHGGIGLHTAAACYAAGAAGVVLDSQLALTQESSLPDPVLGSVARMDGSETVCLGQELGAGYRMSVQRGISALDDLRRAEITYAAQDRPREEVQSGWRREVASRAGWGDPKEQVWMLGQDAAFASSLAKRFRTVGGVIQGVRRAIDQQIETVSISNPLEARSPLAESLGSSYPILQGPMTRVSDKPEFAAEVAKGGGVPFLALALMRATEIHKLLEDTRRLLGNRPWGVGILGFVPVDLREEQLEVVRVFQPPFALIAGGRPDQALSLEQTGTRTYLHVPSPGLLELFLESGARRFVFEGRECGGHVGPRSSFVLWDTMIDLLLKWKPGADLSECHVIFAGGIHDSVSAAMVAAMAAPLSERGVSIGVLLGTAYLLTKEIVATGAIVRGFQDEVIRCTRTVLLETGIGHATRCADTPFAELFRREKQQLLERNLPPEEIREALEQLNLGRLRIASKGIARHARYGQNAEVPKLIGSDLDEQRNEGMYMLGQVATLRDAVSSVAELHREISVQSSEVLRNLRRRPACVISRQPAEPPCDLAIVGMSCILPKAPDLRTYWNNIVHKVNAITEIPDDRWDWRRYFDVDPASRDKIYSKWGGFIDDVVFDPLRYGIPPSAMSSIEPMQLLTLELVSKAMEDAGLSDDPSSRHRTSVIFGVGGGIADLGSRYAVRSWLPELLQEVPSSVLSKLPEWTEDSFAGILLNVVAGRVANRFDLGGVNFTVDAACASSLAALYAAAKELETRSSDVVIAGAVDTVQNPFGYLCFSKTRALSPGGVCRTFDEDADGIVISEGLAAVVLKRLSDAEADGDRIYAVIKGIAGSSDGRARGLTAPSSDGQVSALRRAYAKAGFSPATVGLIEAHGTGTVVGDHAEIESLRELFGTAKARPQSCAIGSVKSMLGHTKCAAGLAGLIKVVLALDNKVLPPTMNVSKPSIKSQSGECAFYVNTETRPWINDSTVHPRRAGVSSFGFGGTNFHAVLEEYTGSFLHESPGPTLEPCSSEVFVWYNTSSVGLIDELNSLERILAQGHRVTLRDLAITSWQKAAAFKEREGRNHLALAVVAVSLDDLRHKLGMAQRELRGDRQEIQDPNGIYFVAKCPIQPKIAFLFPGQGSQYPGMLGELGMVFPEVRSAFERADSVLASYLSQPLSSFIFPPPAFSEDEDFSNRRALTETNVAQPALGAAGSGMFALLDSLGVRPDFLAGHSYGEYVALWAAGVFDEATLYRLSEARGRFILEEAVTEPGTMAAVGAESAHVSESIGTTDGVWIANRNTPSQTVISGTRSGLQEASVRLKSAGFTVNILPTAAGFHSPLVARAQERLAKLLSSIDLATPHRIVFSNVTGEPYPPDAPSIAALLAQHLIKPVEFIKEIRAMYQMGARVFVEVGPNRILTGLTHQILGDLEHVAVACDRPSQPGVQQLHHALAQLIVAGAAVNLDRLYSRRGEQSNLSTLANTSVRDISASAWLVNGSRARLASAALQVHGPVLREQQTSESPRPASRDVLPKVDLRPNFNLPPDLDTLDNQNLMPNQEAPDKVLIGFQRLMKKFLDTQKAALNHFLDADISELLEVTQSPVVASLPIEHASSRVDLTHDNLAPGLTAKESASVDQVILRVVSERTGYPLDVLCFDADIEADLGIDSIKRVEIIGAVQRECLPGDKRLEQETFDRLIGAKKLREIVDTISSAIRHEARPISSPIPVAKVDPPPARYQDEIQSTCDLPRFLLKAADQPHRPSPVIWPDGVFLITDDETGVAERVARILQSRGLGTALLRMGDENSQLAPGIYVANRADPGAVADAVERVCKQVGPLVGLVHLLSLNAPSRSPLTTPDQWKDRTSSQAKILFNLVRAVTKHLKAERNPECAGHLLVATFKSEGLGTSGHGFLPGHGGIAGLVKSVATEWPRVRCKVLDFGTDCTKSEVADLIVQEIANNDSEVQITYQGTRRSARRAERAPLRKDQPAGIVLNSDSVVLLTGGARGITAEVALELAERYHPTLLLAGRSAMPDFEEDPKTARIRTRQELIRTIVDTNRRDGQSTTPASAEAVCERILRDRQIRANLSELKRTGAEVRYHQLDVRDPEAVGRLIDSIYHTYGRLDGVVHGAGVIEDKLIEAKSPESFERVFETKVGGAYALIRHLQPESLQFLAFFSSVAGLFGNRGQADYAAANGTLNELARYLDAVWAPRVVSFNWGPWTGSGMVSSAVARQFHERGVQVISTEAGRRAFDAELRYGTKGQPEVIFGGGPWENVEAQAVGEAREMAIVPALRPGHCGAVEFDYQLELGKDLYLDDHRIDGKAVLPAAMAAELMAEVASQGWPNREVVGIRAFQVLKGVVASSEKTSIRVVARLRTESDESAEVLEVDTDLEVGGAKNLAYRATVLLGTQLPPPPQFEIPMGSEQSQLVGARDAYANYLFHGPRLHCIRDTITVQPNCCWANAQRSTPSGCLARPLARSWIIDPILLDAGPQLAIVWGRTIRGTTALPSEFDLLQRFGGLDQETKLTCFFEVIDASTDHLIVANVYFVDQYKRLVLSLRGLHSTCSKALNRVRSAVPSHAGD